MRAKYTNEKRKPTNKVCTKWKYLRAHTHCSAPVIQIIIYGPFRVRFFFLSPRRTCRLCSLLAHRCLVIIIFYKFCAVFSCCFAVHVHFATHRTEQMVQNTKRKKKKKRKLSPMFSATTVLIAQCSAGEESTRTKTDMFSLVACARAIAHNTCISRMACCQLSPKTSVCRLSLFYFIARSFFSLLDSFSSLRRRRGRRCLCLSRGIQQMCAEQDSFDIVFLLRPHTGVLFSAGQ